MHYYRKPRAPRRRLAQLAKSMQTCFEAMLD